MPPSLLTLPPELRILILQHVIIPGTVTPCTPTIRHCQIQRHQWRQPMFSACRQLRIESFEVFYAASSLTFTITIDSKTYLPFPPTEADPYDGDWICQYNIQNPSSKFEPIPPFNWKASDLLSRMRHLYLTIFLPQKAADVAILHMQIMAVLQNLAAYRHRMRMRLSVEYCSRSPACTAYICSTPPSFGDPDGDWAYWESGNTWDMLQDFAVMDFEEGFVDVSDEESEEESDTESEDELEGKS